MIWIESKDGLFNEFSGPGASCDTLENGMVEPADDMVALPNDKSMVGLTPQIFDSAYCGSLFFRLKTTHFNECLEIMTASYPENNSLTSPLSGHKFYAIKPGSVVEPGFI